MFWFGLGCLILDGILLLTTMIRVVKGSQNEGFGVVFSVAIGIYISFTFAGGPYGLSGKRRREHIFVKEDTKMQKPGNRRKQRLGACERHQRELRGQAHYVLCVQPLIGVRRLAWVNCSYLSWMPISPAGRCSAGSSKRKV